MAEEIQNKQKRATVNKFVGNTGWMMFKNIYSMILSLVVGSLSARYLGPSNYGLINYGSSIIAFFTTVSKLGMDAVVVSEMARSREKESIYLGSALLMRLVTSILSCFAVYGFVVVFEPKNTLLQVVTVLQAIAIIFQSTEVFYYWFQVRLEMKYVTIASIAALTVTAVWRISLLANEASVQWFALSATISALVSGVCITIFFIRKSRLKLYFRYADAKFLLGNSYHFIINGLAVTLYTQLDRIMLGKMVSEEAVGFYSAASTLAVMWEFVPTALINSARPILVKNHDDDKEVFMKRYQYLLLGITFLGIFVSLVFTFFGKFMVHILYGEKYFEAVPTLAVLIWSTSFAMIGTARGIWIVSERKNKYVKYFTFLGAIINTILNALFIPILGGVGAAMTTLMTQIFVSIVAPLLFKETRAFFYMYFSSFQRIKEFVSFGMNYANLLMEGLKK